MRQQSNDTSFENKVSELLRDANIDLGFLQHWNLYKKGRLSRHDLFCEIALLFPDQPDFIAQLRNMLTAASSGNSSPEERRLP